jgi:hypothetical protein
MNIKELIKELKHCKSTATVVDIFGCEIQNVMQDDEQPSGCFVYLMSNEDESKDESPPEKQVAKEPIPITELMKGNA